MGATHEVPDFIARAIEAQGRTTPEEVAERIAAAEEETEPTSLPVKQQEPLDIGPVEPDDHA